MTALRDAGSCLPAPDGLCPRSAQAAGRPSLSVARPIWWPPCAYPGGCGSAATGAVALPPYGDCAAPSRHAAWIRLGVGAAAVRRTGAAALLRQGTRRPALAQAMPAARDEDCEAAGSGDASTAATADVRSSGRPLCPRPPGDRQGSFPVTDFRAGQDGASWLPASGSTTGTAGAAVRFRGLAQPRWGRLAPASRRGLQAVAGGGGLQGTCMPRRMARLPAREGQNTNGIIGLGCNC